MRTWEVSDFNGQIPVAVGTVAALDYDSALGIACDWWPGQVASVDSHENES